eukprot:3582604-Amphidinium_carterae.1
MRRAASKILKSSANRSTPRRSDAQTFPYGLRPGVALMNLRTTLYSVPRQVLTQRISSLMAEDEWSAKEWTASNVLEECTDDALCQVRVVFLLFCIHTFQDLLYGTNGSCLSTWPPLAKR